MYGQLIITLVWGIVCPSELVLLWWWSGQQLTCLTESSNVCTSLLRKDGVPAVHSFLSFPPSLPSSIFPSQLQVLWAPLGSHPSLSHTGPIIGAAHKLVGLQMGRACRTYMVSAARTKTCKSGHKKYAFIWVCLRRVCEAAKGKDVRVPQLIAVCMWLRGPAQT